MTSIPLASGGGAAAASNQDESLLLDIVTREEKNREELKKLKMEIAKLQVEKKKYLDSLKSPPSIPSRNTSSMSAEELRKINEKRKRESIYGGKGEQLHLGGFTANDTDGQSPALWEWMIKVLTVKSFLDIGCGRGISTRFFYDRNVDVLCVEGSADGVSQSLLPRDRIVHHDYYRGPWWPDRTYDVAWSVEFIEHIGRHMAPNYLATMKKAAIIIVTFSTWGGWHHVEVHPDGQYWLYRFAAQGFVYLPKLTIKMKQIAVASNVHGFRAQHLRLHMLVFLNPKVAILPEHAHLYGGAGCYAGEFKMCDGDDALPAEFLPVWAKKSQYDSVDNEMKGVPIDVIDVQAAEKAHSLLSLGHPRNRRFR